MRQTLAIAVLMLLMAFASSAAWSQTCSQNMQPLNLGSYSGSQLDSGSINVTVNCPNGIAYSVRLNAGMGVGATVASRKMTAGSARLNYSLFQDAARTIVWGDTVGTNTRSGVGNGQSQVITIYPRVFAGQVVARGNYVDTVTARVNTSTPTTFQVNGNVVASCTVAAGTLNFGSYTGGVLDAIGTLSVTCNTPTKYNVGLGAGSATGATATTRKMTGPAASTLGYALFSNAGRTTNWGNTGGAGTLAGIGTGGAQSLTVYGRMAAGQSIATPGTYNDTVVVTLTY
jgi:spore coat protein U-like protein